MSSADSDWVKFSALLDQRMCVERSGWGEREIGGNSFEAGSIVRPVKFGFRTV